VKHLIPLYRALYDKVLEYDLLPAYDLLQKVHTLYLRQQLRGVPFDAELFEEMRGKLDEGLEAMLDQLKELAPEHPEGEQWSWRNKLAPDALDQYGNRVGRKGALRALELVGTSLPNLKKFTREAYLKQHDAPLLKALDQYLKFAELLSNAEGWLDLFYEDGRIHPSVKFFSQVTGRSAYADPPMQNIAKDIGLPGMKGTSFRDCVRAPGEMKIVKADYSAQELRILAHVTGDENLTAAFIAQAGGGKDPHLIVGEKIAGKELKRKTEEGEAFRAAGKRANYGFSYGAGWKRYQQSMYEDTAEWIPDEQAEQEKRAFEDAWPGVKEWQQRFGDRSGYEDDPWFTTSFAGRKRWVSQGKEGKPGYCDRLNGPVQQGGADQLYLALGKMIDDPLPGVHVIITTHDEVVLECPEELVDAAKEWLKGHMIAAVRETIGEELATPDCVEVEDGQSWGAA
jgi:DNA polymerase-1